MYEGAKLELCLNLRFIWYFGLKDMPGFMLYICCFSK